MNNRPPLPQRQQRPEYTPPPFYYQGQVMQSQNAYYNNTPHGSSLSHSLDRPSVSPTFAQFEELQVKNAMEISVLTDKIAKLERENMNLKEENIRLNSFQSHRQDQMNGGNSQIQQALAMERNERQRLEREIANYPGQIISLQKQLEDERLVVASLREQIMSDKSLVTQFHNLKLEKEKLHSHNSVIESSIAVANQQLADANRKVADLEFKLKNSEEDLSRIKENLEAADAIPPLLRSEIANLTEKLATINDAKEEEKRALVAQYEAKVSNIEYKYQMGSVASVAEEFFERNVFDSSKPPPAAPSVPRNVDPDVWAIFSEADPYITEKLDAGQLLNAIGNGPWPPLTIKCSKFLIRCINRKGDFIDYNAFEKIWNILLKFKEAFAKFDKTRENEFCWGHVSAIELQPALLDAGVQINKKTMDLFIKRSNPQALDYGWDEFATTAARLLLWKLEFERVDHDKDKCITILYDQYMDLVNHCQTNIIEKFLTSTLISRIEWFNYAELVSLLKSRPEDELDGDVFELLASLGDFNTFKELIIAHKKEKHGDGVSFNDLMVVTSKSRK